MSCVPELRFKEFSEEWENIPLKYLLELKNGLNASKEDYGFGIKFINVLDILENDYITYENIIDCVNANEDQIKNYDVSYGDILFQRSSETREEVGMPNVYLDKDKNCIFGGFVIRGKKIGDYVPFFLKELLRSSKVRKDITSRSGGSTRYNIGQNALEKVNVEIPSLEEQEKIANFLSKIDEKIAILEDKLQLWENYKKGIMQQLFSQELRFKDDDGNSYPDWEEYQLNNLGIFSKGGNLSKNDLSSKGRKCILYGDLFTIYHEIIFNVNNFTEKKSNLVIGKLGDILIPSSTTVDAWSIACASSLMTDNVALGGDINVFKPNFDLINPVFLSYQLNFSKKKEIAKFAQGTTITHLYNDSLKKIKIELPLLEEQDKLAEFVIEIDNKIQKIYQDIKIHEIFKKGLLQKMFCS